MSFLEKSSEFKEKPLVLQEITVLVADLKRIIAQRNFDRKIVSAEIEMRERFLKNLPGYKYDERSSIATKTYKVLSPELFEIEDELNCLNHLLRILQKLLLSPERNEAHDQWKEKYFDIPVGKTLPNGYLAGFHLTPKRIEILEKYFGERLYCYITNWGEIEKEQNSATTHLTNIPKFI